MRKVQLKTSKLRVKRAMRVRKKLTGKPRLTVIKSNLHIHVQLIDEGKVLASTSTLSKEFRATEFNKKNKASGRKLGEKIAELAKDQKIKEVIFDRGCSKYHGVLAAVADGAREAGLEF